MIDKLKDLLTRSKNIQGRDKDKSNANNQENKTGALYKLWLLILPVLAGFVLGRLASILLGYGLDRFTSNAGMVDAAVTGKIQQKAAENNRGLDEFLASNPFHVSPLPEPETAAPPLPPPPPPPEPVQQEEEKKPEVPLGNLDEVIVRGTFPGVGAYLENKGKQQVYLLGKEIEGYKVASVDYRKVIFVRGKERVSKYIIFGPETPKPKKEEPKPQPKKASAPPPPKPEPKPEPVVAAEPDNKMGNIVAAQPGKQDGEVPVEMVSQLVQNPFDELKRIRIRPNEKAGGLEVQWIQSESILKRLGVQKGDIIKSVNGIPFSNMGDIANSINSLMNSERFDVEVTRGGKSTALRYVVR